MRRTVIAYPTRYCTIQLFTKYLVIIMIIKLEIMRIGKGI